MQPKRYGPFPYVPITERPKLAWPDGARLALWVIPNIEFFGLDDPMPGGANERLPKATGHGQTNVVRMDELDPEAERRVIHDTLARIAAATGRKPVGWLGPGLAETWQTLDILADEGCRYVCDWVNDDQPYVMDIGGRRLCSIPYSIEINDVPMVFVHKLSNEAIERRIRRQFDVLYREGAASGRVMAIAVHPFVTGVPHRIDAVDSALRYICSHAGVWKATGEEIVRHYLETIGQN
jgi:peptidoglycan/xylan/chitin deacetylase (PgdA/CDA1 family)